MRAVVDEDEGVVGRGAGKSRGIKKEIFHRDAEWAPCATGEEEDERGFLAAVEDCVVVHRPLSLFESRPERCVDCPRGSGVSGGMELQGEGEVCARGGRECERQDIRPILGRLEEDSPVQWREAHPD